MNHIKLNDEYRQRLLESAAWGKVGVDSGKAPKTEMVNEEAEVEATEEEEVVEEAAHVCPLCISPLEEAIEQERVLEHLELVAAVLDRLDQINESEEDLDSVIAECVRAILLENDEEDVLEEEEIDEQPEKPKEGPKTVVKGTKKPKVSSTAQERKKMKHEKESDERSMYPGK
jgi:hypothetical protein